MLQLNLKWFHSPTLWVGNCEKFIHIDTSWALPRGSSLSGLVACSSSPTIFVDDVQNTEEPTDPDDGRGDPIPVNPFKAPLYWSVYEHHIVQPDDASNVISEAAFEANIDWVEANLKPYCYEMEAIDGWGDVSQFNQYGYRTSHSRHREKDYAWWPESFKVGGLTWECTTILYG